MDLKDTIPLAKCSVRITQRKHGKSSEHAPAPYAPKPQATPKAGPSKNESNRGLRWQSRRQRRPRLRQLLLKRGGLGVGDVRVFQQWVIVAGLCVGYCFIALLPLGPLDHLHSTYGYIQVARATCHLKRAHRYDCSGGCHLCHGLGFSGLGPKQGLGLLGFRVQGSGFRVLAIRLCVLGFRVTV